LILSRDRPRPLGDGVLADALAMGEVACEIKLGLQAQEPPGSLHEVVVAIRARAYATDHPVGEVAADVVARRLRFGPGGIVTPPGSLQP
jgi:hypothetical protein